MKYKPLARVFIFLLLVFCFGCKKESPPDCPPVIFRSITASDKSHIPYTGKETLRFLLIKGTKKDTITFKPYSQVSDTIYQYGPTINDYCEQDYRLEHEQFVYQNTKSQKGKDLLILDYTAAWGDGTYFSVQYDSFSIRSYLDYNSSHFHDTMVFEAINFYKVIDDGEYNFYKKLTLLYFTYKEGIVRLEYNNNTSLTLLQ